MKTRTYTCCLVLLGLATSALAQEEKPGSKLTALDAYVKKKDESYRWKVVQESEGKGYKFFVLEMVSQTWRKKSEVDRTEWTHHLNVIVPDVVNDKGVGFLAISGGSNGGDPKTGGTDQYAKIAVATGSVLTEVRQIPNQPLTYAGETRKRVEDASIAYTWDKYLRGGDDEWPLQLPMTKSAVRAMDAVTEFCASEKVGKLKVEKFVVAGASKRGWTTWLTAVVDKRVIAIAPVVIDMLNVRKSFAHHYRSYGFFAEAVGDYEEMMIMDWLKLPEYEKLLKLVEPYEYRSRLTLPKFIMNSTGDQFFCPDSSQFYFDDLVGEKHLRYVPNTDHGLGGSDAYESLLAFYGSVINQTERPDYKWTMEADGSIKVVCKTQPGAVKLWQASNPKARDFRKQTIGEAWKSTDLKKSADGTYVASIPKPEKGWAAFFVEMTFPAGLVPLKVTSGIRVLPDTLPHGDYKAKSLK